MSASSSVQHKLSILPENAYGVTPDPALLFRRKPITATTLGLARGTVTSAIINPNRQISDVRPGNRQIGGEISTELTWQDHDDLLEALFCGTWTTRKTGVCNDAATNVDGDITSGVKQVTTATIVGTVTGSGNAKLTVTSALLMTPLVIEVAVLNTDTASGVATKARAALNASGNITSRFTVGGAGADITLTVKATAVNDATLNVASDNDTSTGLTAEPTSAATTAGVAGTLPVFPVGEPITIAGMGTGNGRYDVVTSSAYLLQVTGGAGGHVLPTAGASALTFTSLAMFLVPGTTQRSFSILREYSDQTAGGDVKPFQVYLGCVVDKVVLTLQPEQIVKQIFTMFGKEYTNEATAPDGTTYQDASGNKAFDSFTGALKVDGQAVGNVTEMVLNLENGFQPRFVCFRDVTNPPKIGQTKVTGQLTAYFENAVLLDAFINGTKHSIDFSLTDNVGNTYEFVLPSILTTGGQTDVNGENDITIPVPFSAIYEPQSETPDALMLTRIPAPLPS